ASFRSCVSPKGTSGMTQKESPREPLVVSPAEAWRMLDCGADFGYSLIARGEIASYLAGSRRKILVSSIRDYIQRHISASAGKLLRSPQQRRKASNETVTAP